jgi:hypothetical protein
MSLAWSIRVSCTSCTEPNGPPWRGVIAIDGYGPIRARSLLAQCVLSTEIPSQLARNPGRWRSSPLAVDNNANGEFRPPVHPVPGVGKSL